MVACPTQVGSFSLLASLATFLWSLCSLFFFFLWADTPQKEAWTQHLEWWGLLLSISTALAIQPTHSACCFLASLKPTLHQPWCLIFIDRPQHASWSIGVLRSLTPPFLMGSWCSLCSQPPSSEILELWLFLGASVMKSQLWRCSNWVSISFASQTLRALFLF